MTGVMRKEVKILYFEFLLQVASPTISLSKNMTSLSLACVLRFQKAILYCMYYVPKYSCDVNMEKFSRDVKHVGNTSFTYQYHYMYQS